MFERIYSVEQQYDGPIEGVADCGGQPQFFSAIFDEEADDYSGFFYLSPVAREVASLAAERVTIWLRWREQQPPMDRVPSYEQIRLNLEERWGSPIPLPRDLDRVIEIDRRLDGRLCLHKESAVRKAAEFRVSSRLEFSSRGVRWFDVRWYAPA